MSTISYRWYHVRKFVKTKIHSFFKLPRPTTFTLHCISFLAAIALTNGAIAQTAKDIQAIQRQVELSQQQEQQRVLQDQKEFENKIMGSEGLNTDELAPKINLPSDGLTCRQIDNITINGAASLKEAKIKTVINKYTNRCLNVANIENILSELTKYYIDLGYITTRAYLPPQDLSRGHLEILVIEGEIEKITTDDGDKKSISIRNAFPKNDGDLLNLRDLEQGIDQINRLSSNNAEMDIKPGSKVGKSIVLIKNKPTTPFHLNLSLDNQGSKSTGKTQAGINIIADNIMGFNDLLSYTHRQSVPNDYERQYSGSDSVNFSVPFGYTTLSLSSNHSRYASTIEVPSGLSLIAKGTNQTNYLRIDHTVFRKQVSRAMVSAYITTKQSKNYLADQYLGVSSRNLTILDLDTSFSTAVLGGSVSLDLGYARGLKGLSALVDLNNLPDFAPRAQFEKIKLGINYAYPVKLFGRNASFTSQLTAQYSSMTLYGSEQISIGGLYSVRGFVKNSLSGDKGYFLRNEFSVRQPIQLGNSVIPVRFYIGYDTGEVKNITENIPEGRLAGAAAGLSVNLRGATWDFFITRPITFPSNFSREPSQAWTRLAYSF